MSFVLVRVISWIGPFFSAKPKTIHETTLIDTNEILLVDPILTFQANLH